MKPGHGPEPKATEVTLEVTAQIPEVTAQRGFASPLGERRKEPLTESPGPPSEPVTLAGSSGVRILWTAGPPWAVLTNPHPAALPVHLPGPPRPTGPYLTPAMTHTPWAKPGRRPPQGIPVQRPLAHVGTHHSWSECCSQKALPWGELRPYASLGGPRPIHGPHCPPLVQSSFQMTSGAPFYYKNPKTLPS